MKRMQKLTVIAIATIALLTPSLFADSRHRETTASRNDPPRHMRGFTVEGRIRDIDRDRNGFVIRLNRDGEVLFAPVQTRVESLRNGRGRDHVRDLERGDVIRAVVTRRDGMLFVSSITVLRDEDRRNDRNDRWISGVVNDVDRNSISIREDATGRLVRVDLSETALRKTVRRGDRVRIRGDWERGGRFEAEVIEFDGGRMRF